MKDWLSALAAFALGLAVAIPALFGYNYITIRNRNISANMQVFVDEFVTRLAEVYNQAPPEAVQGAASNAPKPPKAPKATGVNGQSSHDARLASTAPVGTV